MVRVPIPLVRFPLRAIGRSRKLAAHGYSLNAVRVYAASLVLDFTGACDTLQGTVGVVELSVLAGYVEILLPRGVTAHIDVATRRGTVESSVGADRSVPHVLVHGSIKLGRLVVREA